MLRQKREVRGHRVLRQIQRLALISPEALRHRAVRQCLLQPGERTSRSSSSNEIR